jgi:hypothetical protein
MTPSVNIIQPDWEAIGNAISLTRDDMRGFAKIIVEGITDRIRNSKTVASGRPISENSKWWIAQKHREGAPTDPLQYKGNLRQPSSYEIAFEGQTCIIRMIGSETQIHIKLQEISRQTGKNYQEWFGIAEIDELRIQDALEGLIKQKLQKIGFKI